LLQICRDDKMPSTITVNDWVRRYPDFSADYAKARDALYRHWAEECLAIADDGQNDWMERETNSGRIKRLPDNETAMRSRLRVDTRKWLLSKLLPREYGDKFDVTSSDGSVAAAFRVAMEQATAAFKLPTKSNGHDRVEAE